MKMFKTGYRKSQLSFAADSQIKMQMLEEAICESAAKLLERTTRGAPKSGEACEAV
jgi:hypothetical protein